MTVDRIGSSGDGYYQDRAAEYDRIYAKPERQADLTKLGRMVTQLLAGRCVLELAAGTGYWTQQIAVHARSVHATDVNAAPLDIARDRLSGNADVTFAHLDAYHPDQAGIDHDAVFAGFWWSHVKRRHIGDFVDAVNASLPHEGRVVVIDNRFVPGSSTPISRTDANGDTYQQRTLANGTAFEVLKNFPTPDEVTRAASTARTRDVRITELEYFWLASWTIEP